MNTKLPLPLCRENLPKKTSMLPLLCIFSQQHESCMVNTALCHFVKSSVGQMPNIMHHTNWKKMAQIRLQIAVEFNQNVQIQNSI